MKARIILGGIGIFILFLILGAVFRMMWFYFVQKEILEYTYIEKPLREAKGGGRTPEETWIGYLNALEKGDIEGAVQYTWSEDREKSIKELTLLKEKNLLKKAVDCDKKIIFVRDISSEDEKFEKEYKVKCRVYKEITYLFTDENLKPLIEKSWGKEPVKNNYVTVIFKYNPYTKRWLIK